MRILQVRVRSLLVCAFVFLSVHSYASQFSCTRLQIKSVQKDCSSGIIECSKPAVTGVSAYRGRSIASADEKDIVCRSSIDQLGYNKEGYFCFHCKKQALDTQSQERLH